GDQIEGELRDPAAQHFVETRHPGRQFSNHDALAHFFSLGAVSSRVSSVVGQALRRTWVTSRSPMKVVRRPKKVPNRATADSASTTEPCACKCSRSFPEPSRME